MALSTDVLSISQARRIALHAQGFNDPRPRGRIDRRHFRRVIDRIGLVQIDSVNVLTRSHELPFLARLGPYPRPALAHWLWRSGEMFEYWGHEAALLPVEAQPLFRWRMADDHAWGGVNRVLAQHPGLREAVLEAVLERGPVTLDQLDHLGDAIKRSPAGPGQMWNWTPAKKAVEHLFWQGEVSARRDPATFTRHYTSPAQIVGEAVLAQPTPAPDDAMKTLLLRAARSHGVGTVRCLVDYFRLPKVAGRRLVEELAADGALRRVTVEGWKQPAYLHPEAELPRWVRASALLTPFDSLVWERARTEALFDFHYRIEIYVPAAQRVHGYYVLPFLHDGELVARLDLKADRQASRLLVRSAHAEPTFDADRSLSALADRLRDLAGFLGLTTVQVESKGALSAHLASAF